MALHGVKGALSALTAGLLILASGCGGQVGDASGEGKATATEAKTIVAATSGQPAPMITVNADGSFAGYEIDLLREADKLIDDYDIRFEKVDFAGITGGLDSGKFQIGVNYFNYTPQREEKFIFSKHPHYVDLASVLTRPGFSKEHPFKTFADIGGYKVPSDSNGSNWQTFVEDYNKLYPDNPIKIEYTPADRATILRQINQGVYDFGTGGRFHQKVYGKDLGVDVDYLVIPDSIATTDEERRLLKSLHNDTHFLFPKTDEGRKIADAVDKALLELYKNGTMKELSLKYLGYDMTGGDDNWLK